MLRQHVGAIRTPLIILIDVDGKRPFVNRDAPKRQPSGAVQSADRLALSGRHRRQVVYDLQALQADRPTIPMTSGAVTIKHDEKSRATRSHRLSSEASIRLTRREARLSTAAAEEPSDSSCATVTSTHFDAHCCHMGYSYYKASCARRPG